MKIRTDTSWDLSIEVCGLVVPTLSPLTVGEADAAHTPRTPGVLVRIWRWLVGQPDTAKRETEQVRGLCRMFVPKSFWPQLDTMNGGELALLYSAYMGAQTCWCGRIKQQAEAAAEAQWQTKHTGGTPVPPTPGNTVQWPTTPLRGGQPVPAILHGLGVNEVNGMPVEEARIGSREVAHREEQRHA